jgi:hydroxypyruvate isomerase
MPRFAANLTLLFTEYPLRDRFAAAADAGFSAVEILYPDELSPDVIAAQLARHRLTLALINVAPGNIAAGERGLAALGARFDELQAAVQRGLEYAAATGTRRVHLMAGLADANDADAISSYRRALRWTASRCADVGIEVMIEPINSRDIPGYFLNDFAAAERLLQELALPNVRLQFDIYHRQIIHGDVIMALRRLLPIIGHIQIAGVPERHEPGSGELNDAALFAELDRLGYSGFVGCEYRPDGATRDSLGWFAPYRASQR